MAAIFPLDTTKPWIFNGVTYVYDDTEDRWYVTSTTAVDSVTEGIEANRSQIDLLDTLIDQEIDNRNSLLNAAASKNNEQDAEIAELDSRVDAIGAAVGILEFKGRYNYVLEKTVEACTAAYAMCLLQAGGDVPAMSECNRLKDVCEAAVGDAYDPGSFTSKGTTNVMLEVEEFVIAGVDLDNQSIDWLNLVEVDDYIEFFETNNGDTALYQVIEEPKVFNTERSIRVKYLSQTGLGDGNFNLQEEYEIRVIKSSVGLDVIQADARYVQKPYSVLFQDTAPTTGNAPDGVLRSGELWYDTRDLELFVWNNNAWTAAAKPPSQDVLIQSVINDVDNLLETSAAQNQRFNSLLTDLLLENNIYYSDNAPTGDITGTLRNGDLWVDSDDLTIKFYSGGAWINPDRQVGGNYLEKTGGLMTGDIDMEGGPESGANIYMYNNGFIRFGWGHTAEDLYGGYVFMRDEDLFEVGTYSNKALKFKAGEYLFENKLNLTRPRKDFAGNNLVIHGRVGGVEGSVLFKDYQRKASESSQDDYIVYYGSCEGDKRILNREYADNRYIKADGDEMSGKLTLNRLSNEQKGFTVEGRTTDNTIEDLFYVYHNSGTVADAVNYTGRTDSSTNIQTKESVLGLIGAAGVPVGTIAMWMGASAPAGWLFCRGNSFNINTYPLLHAHLQEMHGYVSGKTPDFKGQYPGGAGAGPANLTPDQAGYTHAAKTGQPSGGPPSSSGTKPNGSTRGFSAAGSTNAYSDGVSKTVIDTGWDSVTRPPTLSVNFIIKHD